MSGSEFSSDDDRSGVRIGRGNGVELDEGTLHTGETKKTINRLRQAVLRGLPQLADTYQYQPLRELLDEEIRVLVLEPGKKDDPIRVKLVPSALHDCANPKTKIHKFNALSYFWGQGDPIETISVSSFKNLDEPKDPLAPAQKVINAMNKYREGARDGTLMVRTNLKSALVHFRHRKEPQTLWIDALCINQANPEERSRQVAKMHRLYVNADIVSVWLGDGTTENPTPEHCFDFLRRILNLQNLEKLLRDLEAGHSKLVESARDVIRLMRNKWFSRRWVVQELALAHHATVVYGKERMPWSDFSDAIAIFMNCKDRIVPPVLNLLRATVADNKEIFAAQSIEDLGANILVDFTNSFFRRDRDGKIQQRMMSLEILVSSLLPFEATDPRDTIYAVLSLANDTHDENQNLDQRLVPDYKRKRLLDVYTNFITYCAEKSKSLDILLRHWATTDDAAQVSPHKKIFDKKVRHSQKQGLPSWIPLIADSSHGTPEKRAKGRSFGDSFVWNSFQTSHKNYCATLDLPPIYRFGEKNALEGQEVPEGQSRGKICDGCLFVQGLKVGNVDALSTRAGRGIIFGDALELAGFDEHEYESKRNWSRDTARVPEEFWRTMVADRGPYGRNTPSWYPRACMEALNNRSTEGDIDPDDVMRLSLAPSLCKSFLKRVKPVIWGRKFARIDLTGTQVGGTETYGLLPGRTIETDIICLLFGCSVPVVLRPHEGDTYYEMIGECFIYGIMQGEAVSSIDESRCFELR